MDVSDLYIRHTEDIQDICWQTLSATLNWKPGKLRLPGHPGRYVSRPRETTVTSSTVHTRSRLPNGNRSLFPCG